MDTYTRAGSGEPLLLIHGLGHSRRAWDGMIELLAPHHDVVAVDLPGHGSATELSGMPTPTALADHLCGVMDDLGWDSAHIAGSSLGGLIAIRLAEVGRARSTTVFSPGGMVRGWEHRYTGIVLSGIKMLGPRVLKFPAMSETALGRRLALGVVFGRPQDVTPDYAAAAMRASSQARAFHETRKAITEVDAVGHIATPMTIAWGAKDRLLFPRQGRRWKARIPHARLIRLPGLGHLPMGEDPQVCSNLILTTAASRDTTHAQRGAA